MTGPDELADDGLRHPPPDDGVGPARGSTGAGRLHPALLLPVGALVWWLVGFLPWLTRSQASVGGSTTGTGWLALPLRTSSLGLLVVCATVGSVLAGVASLLARRPGVGAALGGAGVLLAALLAVAQSSSTLGRGGSSFDADAGVLAGLVVVVLAVSVVGWAIGVTSVLGRPGTGRPGLAVALAVVAGVGPAWFGALTRTGSSEALLWIGALLLVVALVAAGARPPARLAWWPLVLVVAWFVGPAVTASAYLEQLLRPGSGLDAARVVDALAAAVDVFQAAASPSNRQLVPWVVAVPVALVVAVALARRQSTTGESWPGLESAPDGTGDRPGRRREDPR